MARGAIYSEKGYQHQSSRRSFDPCCCCCCCRCLFGLCSCLVSLVVTLVITIFLVLLLFFLWPRMPDIQYVNSTSSSFTNPGASPTASPKDYSVTLSIA